MRFILLVTLSLILMACDTLSGINTSQFKSEPRGVADGLPLGARHLNDLKQYGIVLADSSDGTHIILPADRLFSETADRVIINPDFHNALNQLVYVLQGYPKVKLEVVGHTDGVMSPSLQDNQASKFAYEVTNYLTGAGISPTRITSVRGAADRQPISRQDNVLGRSLNRRVEVITASPIK